MYEVSIVGVDLAKLVFQVHGAARDGSVLFRKKLTRPQFVRFMTSLPACIVAMEACGTAHYWGREMERLGHDVRLIPPIYVKPFVKRQKNDMADAEAIAEAAMRPTMRTVPVKSPDQQARAMLFRTRELLVGQRTQLVNALRAHLAEHGVIVPKGLGNIERLATIIRADSNRLPDLVRRMSDVYLDQIGRVTNEVRALELQISAEAKESPVVRRLRDMPGIGPICAIALEAFAPPMQIFRRGRDFAAWLGLVPRQHSSGGKQKLGRTSKMGQRDIRRLLILGAMSVVRWRGRNGGQPGTWLAAMLARKPKMLVAIALANKMARMIWAMLIRDEEYRVPKGAVC
ncbi:MAG TPA: IS110 family transposase [Hyphomonas sp.]|uniref:IS110 family transposase n=1 Tax=Roseovarius mucosus TaxID=215743 RepID=UPI000ECFB7E8|nr:IS110 family transposase [Hyphomonas sp.]|tara:strand:- start:1151 stop:2179 length:1029 start_codon:yes stop_codon:yes gene_type:complete